MESRKAAAVSVFVIANFFFSPTYFHEQPEKVREIDFKFFVRSADRVEINFFAKLEFVKTITSWKTAQALDPLHILKNEVVRERFEYDKAPGLQAGFVRIFQVVPSWTFPNRKAYGGCRSWVKLPESPKTLHLEPVMSDGEHGGRRNEFYDIIERAKMFAASD